MEDKRIQTGRFMVYNEMLLLFPTDLTLTVREIHRVGAEPKKL